MNGTMMKLIFYCCLLFTIAGVVYSYEGTLSDRATNPLTNLTQIQFENDFSSLNAGSHKSSNLLTIKPIIAIHSSQRFPWQQLIRIKFQIPTLPPSSQTTSTTCVGDTQLFDLFIKKKSWGKWGIGPVAILPTATQLQAGQGKWQLGPAFGISILKYKKWQFGFLAQNPLSFAGHPKLTKQNTLYFQPFITYHYLKNDYITTNAEWTIDWIHHTQQIPINIGIGHTFSIGTQKIDTSLDLEWMAYQNAVKEEGYVNQFTVQLSFNLLFN